MDGPKSPHSAFVINFWTPVYHWKPKQTSRLYKRQPRAKNQSAQPQTEKPPIVSAPKILPRELSPHIQILWDQWQAMGAQCPTDGFDSADIKKIYRQLVRKFHPDLNQDPGAIEKFLIVQESFETLLTDVSLKISAKSDH
ncbi:MAG: DnaJ domain-containing protein [Bdellovibrionales bacterium]|nr:DnaJ domain-containing protein [Bdellovibrionales bacterium]